MLAARSKDGALINAVTLKSAFMPLFYPHRWARYRNV